MWAIFYSFRRNLDPKHGLVNGSMGVVEKIEKNGEEVERIIVNFDNVKDLVSLNRISVDFDLDGR